MTTYGILIFAEAEELDFAGPWEVFTTSAILRNAGGSVVSIAERPEPVRFSKGLRVLPDHTLDDHPPLDVLLIPGGRAARETEPHNTVVTEWIARTAATAEWVASVCTGAFLLHAAGPGRGRRLATHWKYEDALEARGDVTVVRDARFVIDGKVLSTQGVSAGIDGALWLVSRLHGSSHAREVGQEIQYDPLPPFHS
ncbi:DJ-1/PfpI family protein [Nocardia cyriacigeorgica]|uniref:DJ-1/PfpI family protein n=1 Tax=Nocardia cyriacigeorgica TaxID=135487 RepID=UPI0013D48C0A|nr:DJ-1/PfpI family protein [Nocardia cyriacigeorgica]NEW25454.1 DJ-1/PfpI family protein [Nocardia cyriacigeorgica]